MLHVLSSETCTAQAVKVGISLIHRDIDSVNIGDIFGLQSVLQGDMFFFKVLSR